MGKQVVIVGTITQSAADVSTTVSAPTGLLDGIDKVLRVLSVEFQIAPQTVMSWAHNADMAVVAVISNKDKGLTIGLQHRSVVKSFGMAISGIAAAVTEYVIPVEFSWVPAFNAYLYNETVVIIFGSFSTGVANSGTFRIVCEEVTVGQLEKTQMKALV